MNNMKKGIQLYSVRDKCTTGEGLVNVIGELAAMGYEGVEFCDYAGVEAAKLGKVLKDNGIVAFNAHVRLERFRENLEKEIEYGVALGMRSITIPAIPAEERNTEGYRRFTQEVPAYIEACAKAGLKLCYHNHNFEYESLNGQFVLDMLLESNPDMILELDSFWTFFAGVTPQDVMKKYAGRLKYLHIKDYLDKDAGPPPIFCAIGKGYMENAPIVACAGETGVEWIVVEQDNSQIDSIESARLSVDGMKAMGL